MLKRLKNYYAKTKDEVNKILEAKARVAEVVVFPSYDNYVLDEKTVQVVKSTDLLTANGLIGSCVFKLTDKDYMIVIEDDFEELPIDFQKFILAHEEGHIFHNHLDNITPSVNVKRAIYGSLFGTIPTMEKEADYYAYKKCGKEISLKSLKRLSKMVDNDKEIRARFKLINQL